MAGGVSETSRKWSNRQLALMFSLLSVLYLASMALTLLHSDGWLRFRVSYLTWSLSFLAIASVLLSGSLPSRWKLPNGPMGPIALFFSAMVLHGAVLLFEPTLSQDLMRLTIRGELMMDGAFPYRDFDVNKPPLYIWTVGLISKLLGPSELSFRAVFTFFDSMVPPLVLVLGRTIQRTFGRNNVPLPLKGTVPDRAALIALLWPVGLLESSLAGHFDPLVVVPVLLALLFGFKGRHLLSGTFLGVGFALKFYPLAILPLLFLNCRSWKDRGLLLSGFASAPFLSILPLIFKDPSLLFDYLSEQSSGWGPAMSIRYVAEEALSFLGGLEGTILFIAFAGALLAMLLLLYTGILRGRLGRGVLLAGCLLASATCSILIVYSSLIVMAGPKDPLVWATGLATCAMTVSFTVLGTIAALGLCGKDQTPRAVEHPKGLSEALNGPMDPHLLIAGTAASLMLLVFLSSQFHPWYLLWIMPLFVLSDVRLLRSFLLLSLPLQLNTYPPWEVGHFR